MTFSLRIFIVYFLLIGSSGYYLFHYAVSQVKPAMRQSTEELLVDMSNLLAEVVVAQFVDQDSGKTSFNDSGFVTQVDAFMRRPLAARIFSVSKSQSRLRIYITDNKGIVRYHSSPRFQHEVGKDYSQWNDVFLTLKGRYGARSTEDISGKALTTVMYVAAPIVHKGQIIGVLTVGKPGVDIQPFIDSIVSELKTQGMMILAISLLAGSLLALWLTRSIRKLTVYAERAAKGEAVTLPELSDRELKSLGSSMETMRIELEGKHYVEQYVHSLTHELKSPIAAIKGAIELLDKNLDEQDFNKLKNNVEHESLRLNDFVNRMLSLVRVESIEHIENASVFDVNALAKDIIDTKKVEADKKQIAIELKSREGQKGTDVKNNSIKGDRLLIGQCIDNLLQNALDFSRVNDQITIQIQHQQNYVSLAVKDNGEGIPDYAIDRISERFYSLPRPNGGAKSTGIGLSFVQQVMRLHSGTFSIANKTPSGVEAVLSFNRSFT